jgi:spermidine/putrescine transport system substrate-binding protein
MCDLFQLKTMSRLPLIPTRRQFLKTAIALSGLSLTGCGWTLAEVRPSLKPGNKDEIYIYTWASYTDDALLETFKAQTGIQAKADIFPSNEVMFSTFQSGKGALYSIIYPSDYMVEKMLEKGYLAELDHSRINGLENILPQFQKSSYDPGNRHSIPISWGTTGFIYNADKLPSPPEDWDYLWKNQQQLARRLTLLDDTREVMGATLKSLGYSYNSDNPKEVKEAYEKLVQLKPAIASFTTDAWKERLLAGDLVLSMVYSADAVGLIQENPKLNLKYVIPKSGSSLWSDTMVIPKTAPNPDAAYAWINYMLQPSVAVGVTQRLYFATPNQAAFDQLPAPLRNDENLFPPNEVLKACERISPFTDIKSTELFEQYWNRLTSG